MLKDTDQHQDSNKPDPESLKGSDIQQTLLRLAKILQVKALWHSVPCIVCRLVSTLCPFCTEQMKLVRKTRRSRIYRYPICSFKAYRDLVPAYNILTHYTTMKREPATMPQTQSLNSLRLKTRFLEEVRRRSRDLYGWRYARY